MNALGVHERKVERDLPWHAVALAKEASGLLDNMPRTFRGQISTRHEKVRGTRGKLSAR
jgi:hypothetical protein